MFGRSKHTAGYRRDRAEIRSLTERDLDDLGLSKDELIVLVQTPEPVAVRQRKMAARFGLTDGDLSDSRHDLVAAVQRCRNCGATQECATYLANPDLAADQATFCPNADTYRGLAR